MNFDYYLFQQLNNAAGQHKLIGDLTIFFVSYFQYVLVAGLLAFLFFGKDQAEKTRNRIMVFLALLSAIVAMFVFIDLIRLFYYRPRPFLAHQAFQLINHEATSSFPSGHAAFFFGLAMAIYFFNKGIAKWFFIGAFLISLARIFCGVHYPLDIFVGAIVGIFTGWLVKLIFVKMKIRQV